MKNTDYANCTTHPHISFNDQPHQCRDYYKPSKQQKMEEMVYISGGMMAVSYVASKWL